MLSEPVIQFIQMLNRVTLGDSDTLLMHVLTAESFHISNWVSTFTFPLIKLQFYVEVISLDISRSSSILFFSNVAYTTGHKKRERKNPVSLSNLCSPVKYFFKSWHLLTVFHVPGNVWNISYIISWSSCANTVTELLFLDSFCKGY